MSIPSAPLFEDPIHDGAADPVVVWNYEEKVWYMLYTNRRADSPGGGFAWVHGTDIGVASSSDHGATWLYRGTLPGLEFEPGRNTFWAPEVIRHDGLYHMYVSYVRGIPTTWDFPRRIIHKTSQDLWHWNHQGELPLSSERVIDACVFPLPEGGWRMWYKDEGHNSHTWFADSDDLYQWEARGTAIDGVGHEGPNVFGLGGYYWMIVDIWKGMAVYRSTDLLTWSPAGTILDGSGTRAQDDQIGRHGDVHVQGDEAFVFYFVHPGASTSRTQEGASLEERYRARRSVVQVARLTVTDGILQCDRDGGFHLSLAAP